MKTNYKAKLRINNFGINVKKFIENQITTILFNL